MQVFIESETEGDPRKTQDRPRVSTYLHREPDPVASLPAQGENWAELTPFLPGDTGLAPAGPLRPT